MKLLFFVSLIGYASAFTQQSNKARSLMTSTTTTATTLLSSIPSDMSSATLTLNDLKTDLVRACNKATDKELSSSSLSKPTINEIRSLVKDLEDKAEMIGEGQTSSSSGLMAGEWYVYYFLLTIIIYRLSSSLNESNESFHRMCMQCQENFSWMLIFLL